MRLCPDCLTDISDRPVNSNRCKPCQAEYEKAMRRRYSKERRGIYGVRALEKIKTLNRTCNVCGKPVRHRYDDARSCIDCRRAVLATSDSMCEGATGDPGFKGDWTMDIYGETWRDECHLYIDD